MAAAPRIDALQFCVWDAQTFAEMRAGGLCAVHATATYHGNFRVAAAEIKKWRERFRRHSRSILPGLCAADIERARREKKTAIFLGFQNPSPFEDDLSLVGASHDLGIRISQIAYNNQSLLACGWREARDSGVTTMGRAVIREMNRLGMIVDLSHAAEKSALQAIEISTRPVAATHANPRFWRRTRRNLSRSVLRALADSGGMLGLSLYPVHLRRGGACSLDSFCEMAARAAEIVGARGVGIGSDLCRRQPPPVLRWMREGKWARIESAPRADDPPFAPPPVWFQSAADFDNLARGLAAAGFSKSEVGGVLGGNWLRFLRAGLAPGR